MAELGKVSLGQLERVEHIDGRFAGCKRPVGFKLVANGIGGEGAFAPGGADHDGAFLVFGGLEKILCDLVVTGVVVDFLNPFEGVQLDETLFCMAVFQRLNGGLVALMLLSVNAFKMPKHILTVAEVETVLRMPDLNTPVGIRDRAIMETLYSTGMRRMEVANLKLYDFDRERGTVIVRQGKGRKDRMLPIGERALAWILKYMNEVRPRFATEPDAGWLWLGPHGDNIMPATLGTFVGDYVRISGIGKQGSCHMFRHTMATLMLENGCDVRFIQAMLGHVKLDTTELYTHVSIRKLKEVHSRTHPAKMERTPGQVEETSGEADPGRPAPDPEQEREELFTTLALESDERES